jgi:glyoxylase-like metal-dependent hydrolase (beta-lactamase superfamily II)
MICAGRTARELADGVFRLPVLGGSVFLLLDGREVTLVDAGFPGSAPAIHRALARLGRRPKDLRLILITHGHPDHVGGLGDLLDGSGADVGVHRLESPAVRGHAEFPSPFAWPLLGRLLGPVVRRLLVRARASRVRELEDGDRLPVCGGLRIVHTPGHTDGHLALFLEKHRLLLGGDSLQRCGDRLRGPHFLYTRDRVEAERSARRLAQLDVRTLALTHYSPLEDAGPALRDLAGRLGAAGPSVKPL